MYKEDFFAFAPVIVLIIVLLVGITMKDREIKKLKQNAIELNHAEYNQKTGEWQWKTNSVQIK